MSDSLQPHGLYCPWNSPGQNTGVGNLYFLQGIFLTQKSNRHLLRCRRILYQLSYQGRDSEFQVSHLLWCYPGGTGARLERSQNISVNCTHLKARDSNMLVCGLSLLVVPL